MGSISCSLIMGKRLILKASSLKSGGQSKVSLNEEIGPEVVRKGIDWPGLRESSSDMRIADETVNFSSEIERGLTVAVSWNWMREVGEEAEAKVERGGDIPGNYG